jgi:DNA-binding GntR family transcriptional regulator
MSSLSLKRTSEASSRPLYVQLAQMIGSRIAEGQYSVGALLPTEAELGETYGVSRYTVRQAIQHLRHQGLVSARKGVGTRVEAREGKSRYTHAIHSLAEILQYASETRLQVLQMDTCHARGAVAELLGCRPGKPWLHTLGVRYSVRGGGLPFCLTDIYVDDAYKAIASEIGKARVAVCDAIERKFGETIVEIEQQIEGAVLSRQEAEQLDAVEGSPALRTTRRYFVTGRRLIELSISLHPADRFSYAMTIKRDVPA